MTTYAIASGKGGTGKTTVSVHLARLLVEQGAQVQYLDCDVEEPNGHIFLKPEIERTEEATVPVPVIDATRCIACGKCAEVCEFNAIATLKTALVFAELCHGCGGCALACPVGAIQEQPRSIGVVETGRSGAIGFVQGRLNVGEAMAGPLIRAVRRAIEPDSISLIDAPPGTACAVVATVRETDYVILVTEPTPFGLNDLQLAVELMRELGRRCGVIINRAVSDHTAVQAYCREEGIPILAEIKDSRKVAEYYSRGEMMMEPASALRTSLLPLATSILQGNPEAHCS
ncbi:MAG: ATP-binding protein [Verrucomicrobiota bacterium]